MSMMNNLKSGLSDMKSRTLLFVMLIALVFLGIILFVGYHNVTQNNVNPNISSTRLSNPASNIRSIPGVSGSSKAYDKLQSEKTKSQAITAYETGGSDLSPILSPGKSGRTLSELERQESRANAAAGSGGAGAGGAGAGGAGAGGAGAGGSAANNRLANLLGANSAGANADGTQDSSSLSKLQKQLAEQQKAQQAALAKAQQQQQDALQRQQDALKQQQYKQELSQQIQALRNAGFGPQVQPSLQTVVYAEKPKKTTKKKSGDVKPTILPPPKIIYKAGTMLQAVLLSSVNSDTPAPIVAQVVNGALKGARLVGSIDKESIPQTSLAVKVSKALVLNFNIISIPQLPYSLKIKAIGINPNTASTSIASDVDNHYLMRYGTFLGAAFLSGLAKVISTNGQKIVSSVSDNTASRDNPPAIQKPTLSRSDEIAVAVGDAMQQMISQVNYLGTPPTIRIDSGVAVGLLLLDDLTEQKPQNTVVQKVGGTTTIEQSVPSHSHATNTSLADKSKSIASNASTAASASLQQQLNQLNSLVGGNNN
tara:strand:- start:6551 stop:8164 length:1614 start_codon:yes stop_codon:yes gene_type:complete